jgi:DNA-binding CsgD family transcriptional regulator
MGGTEELASLIGDIYDAALHPSAWPAALAGVNAFVGGQASGIYSKDTIRKTGVTHHYIGADPYYIQLYAESHAQFDPVSVLPPKGQVTTIPDLVSYDEYRRGPFYHEWLRPQGFADAVNVVLASSGLLRATLLTVLPGRARMVDADMRRRVELLVPHLERALSIQDSIKEQQQKADALSGTLDGFDAAVFLLNDEGGVVHANETGKSMLRQARILRLSGGLLSGCDADDTRTVQKLLAAEDGAHAVLVAHASDGDHHYVLQRLELETRAAVASKAVAAILVREARVTRGLPTQLIGRAFNLTPTVLRVLLAIVDLGGVPEAATALGVAETTVKTHLHRIFSKTGTSRQTHLVKLAAGFLTPLLR